MSKYNRDGKIRKRRRWYQNVGDPNHHAQKGISNPNDKPKASK